MRVDSNNSGVIGVKMKDALVVNRPDLKVWSNGAKDVLVKKYKSGKEKWRLYRDLDDDGIFEETEVVVGR